MFAFTEEISKTSKAQTTKTERAFKTDSPKTLIAFKDMEVLPFLQRYCKEQCPWNQNLKVFPQIFSEYVTWLFQNQK